MTSITQSHSLALDLHDQWQAERRREDGIGHDVPDRTGGDDTARAEDQRMTEGRGDLLHVMGDQHGGRRELVVRQDGERRDQVLPAAQVEAGGRLVQE